MSREDAHFKLRLPDDLRANLKASAALSRRSLTAEIIQRLYQSLEDEKDAFASGLITGLHESRKDTAGVSAAKEMSQANRAAQQDDLRERLAKMSEDEVQDVLRTLDIMQGLFSKK